MADLPGAKTVPTACPASAGVQKKPLNMEETVKVRFDILSRRYNKKLYITCKDGYQSS